MLWNCPDCSTPISMPRVSVAPSQIVARAACSNCGSIWEATIVRRGEPKFSGQELKDRKNRPS